MSTAVIVANPQLPAAIRNLLAQQGGAVMEEVTGGVTSGFPVISYRGKVWRIRKSGVEEDVLNEEGDPVPNIPMVLIKSNPMPSKIFYEKNYEEGATDSPDCWSADGIKPDAGVQKPICKTCAACPKNVWGSKITQQNKKTKACSDARRMAVVSLQELEEKGEDAPLYLLRVPPASLNPLKDYAEKVLKPKGIPYFAVITKVGFDKESSFPKMTFRAMRMLSEDEAMAVLKLRDSEDARRILAESEEFAEAGTPVNGEASAAAEEDESPAPAAVAPKKKAAPRPAEEEDVGLDEIPAAPAPKKAAVKAAPAPVAAQEDDDFEMTIAPPKAAAKKPVKVAPAPVIEEEEEEIAPPPPPKAAKKPARAVAPPPVVEEEEEEIAPPAKPAKAAKAKAAPATELPADGGDFDSMLESILGS